MPKMRKILQLRQFLKCSFARIVGSGGDDITGFCGGSGGGIDIGSVGNDAVAVVVAVENRWFLSHLQRLIDVKVRG